MKERANPRANKRWLIHYMPTEQAVERWNAATVVNFSRGGVCFHTDEWIAAGVKLKLKFDFPGQPPGALQGTVIWCRDAGIQGKEHGVRFEQLPPDSGKVIDQLVQAWLRREAKGAR